jgi:FtsH-binding integral membrane protein
MNTTILDNSETIYPINHQVLLNKYITKVFGWMSLALILTGITSLVVVSSETLLNTIFSSKLSFYLLIGAEFLLVMAITSLINKMSTPLAFLLFVVYTAGSIASTFFITAGTFAIMSIVGYFTKKDLTSFGQILFMIFIGLMIASLVNFFMNSDTLYWICTYAGVIVFTGLTAYDTQKIKNIGIDAINQNMDTSKMALMGALNLYLDFINLFLFLLRLFGRRK